MMKKGLLSTLIFIIALTMAMPVLAQNYHNGRPERPSYNGGYNNRTLDGNEIYYGLRLGLGFGTVNNSEADEYDGPSNRTGLNIGAVVGFQLSPSAPVYLESGLFYTEKGGRNNTVPSKKVDYNLNYLELPILVKYCVDIDGEFSVQPFLGGYLAYGVGGKIKHHDDNKDNRFIESAFSRDLFKRFDGGLRFGCGVEYQMLYADLAYELGLANIGRDAFEKTHNSCFYLNIGVNF